MSISRRTVLTGISAAALAPALPAMAKPMAFPSMAGLTDYVPSLYGRGPMMVAVGVMQRHSQALGAFGSSALVVEDGIARLATRDELAQAVQAMHEDWE